MSDYEIAVAEFGEEIAEMLMFYCVEYATNDEHVAQIEAYCRKGHATGEWDQSILKGVPGLGE